MIGETAHRRSSKTKPQSPHHFNHQLINELNNKKYNKLIVPATYWAEYDTYLLHSYDNTIDELIIAP